MTNKRQNIERKSINSRSWVNNFDIGRSMNFNIWLLAVTTERRAMPFFATFQK